MYLRIKKYRLSIHIVAVMFSLAIIDKIVIEVQWQRVKYMYYFWQRKTDDYTCIIYVAIFFFFFFPKILMLLLGRHCFVSWLRVLSQKKVNVSRVGLLVLFFLYNETTMGTGKIKVHKCTYYIICFQNCQLLNYTYIQYSYTTVYIVDGYINMPWSTTLYSTNLDLKICLSWDKYL